MPSSHLILCRPLLFLPPIPPSATPKTAAPQAPLSQARILGYHALIWVICLLNSGMKPAFFTSPALVGGFFTTSTPLGSPVYIMYFTDAGRDWGQEEKGTTEDEMAGWHHQLDGCEFE